MKIGIFIKRNKAFKSGFSKKIVAISLFFILIFSSLFVSLKPANAQLIVFNPEDSIWKKIQTVITTLWRKGGSLAFQQTLRSALNKMAYDTATWVGSGGEGQKPLFVTEGWGAYMARIGDEAAGTYLENFSANLSESTNSGLTINFCQPSSLDIKVRIGLGLANQYRPQGPNCTATEMISNWSKSAAQKYADFQDPQFLDKFVNVFNPTSNDVGIYFMGKDLLSQEQQKSIDAARTTLLGKGGWLDPLKINGDPVSLPNQAQIQIEGAYSDYSSNFGTYTGDAFIDAANLFLNQLAITSFNRLVQNLGKKTPPATMSSPGFSSGFQLDPNVSGGQTRVQETARRLIQPNFGMKADYSILSELAMCPDKNNPGPTNCVIDNKFMQAISEQKTVGEALKEGYLNGSWQFLVSGDASSYENNFSWRNVSILRKYRILPASWELAFEKMERLKIGAANQVPNVEEKSATLMDLISCFNPYDEYNEFSSQFDVNDQAWCAGLVDPNWVLKAPLNFCAKEGVGPQIINRYVAPSQPAYGTNPYIPSYLNIVRAENYCADHQTCIKEARDGSCQAYGYCNEEKRIWRFDGDFCEPIDNTCQAFVNPETRAQVAYLENTLDYSECSADNAGCKQYSNSGVYNDFTGTVFWNDAGSLYFNKKIENCSSADEGCSELIRVKSAWGTNLVMNSSFINDQVGASTTGSILNEWPLGSNNSRATIVDAALEPGGNNGKAIKLEGNPALLYSDGDSSNLSLVPKNFEILQGRSYTVSADIYLASGSRAVIALGSGENRSTYESTVQGLWHHISVTKQAGEGFNSPSFSLAAYDGAILYIKNIKFEMSPWDTGYSNYGATKSYQKLLPSYLESACYVGETANGFSYQLKQNAPVQCYNYARRCDRGEVGCELYRSARNNFAIPAKVSDSDYCPGECVGYDVYIARETYFTSAQAENLIPNTATTCNASAVGCTEFTNLDDLQTGGERREYYSQLKQCVKPGQANCADFYYWEGTGTGYQLNAQKLQVKDGAPVTIADDSELCNEEIFNSSVTSPNYNPDCRQFYNAAGQIFYHLNSYTVTCSENCRAYRMTERNFDRTITNDECVGDDRNWNNQEGACVVCLNGGAWNSAHNACVYQGIPGEGKVCEASQNGCREYNGSAGNNVRLVAAYDFESPSPVWTSNCTNGIQRVTVASTQGGHSLLYNSSASGCGVIGEEQAAVTKNLPIIKEIFAGDNQAAQLKIGTAVMQNKAYNVKFWANSSAGAQVKMYFLNPDINAKAEFNGGEPLAISGGGGWQLYSVNLENLNHQVSPNEKLIITANNNFYFDNFILTEITDRYYLIKSSSQIPDICYYDILDVYRGPDYNLGCTAYTDRAGRNHNLHSFSSICDASSVGCEQVISTNNYSSYKAGIWNDNNNNNQCDFNEPDCVQVPADTAMYVVYDASKQCTSANLGCSRLGQALAGSNASAWSDVFKKNNPNRYNQILCEEESLGCEEWSLLEGGGFSYFRDPGSDVCVYRLGINQSGAGRSWYKAPVKRCDLNGDGQISGSEQASPVCNNDSDCGGQACIADNNDYLCDVSYLETIGYGGPGNEVPVPSNQAGLCDIRASGCREYIDPVSQFNPDLTELESGIQLQQNKLYVFAFIDSTSTSSATLSFSNDVRALKIDNTFADPSRELGIGGSAGARKSIIFNSLTNTSANLAGQSNLASVREVVVDYQIVSSVDKQSCNGLVDFPNGCVLFNERSFSGASGYANLQNGFDPYTSIDKRAPSKCTATEFGACANQLIKVKPDRVCATWLDCRTYSFDEVTGEKICYSLGQCNSLDDKGECDNFISNTYEPNYLNATGYYLLGKSSISNMSEVGLNSNIHFDFEELIPAISCVRKDETRQDRACNFDRNIVKDLLVREPVGSPVDYPASGKSYLRIPSDFKISPLAEGDHVSLSPGQEYYLSYLLNTKNSAGSVVVTLESRGGNAASSSVTFTASSPNGWSRQVHRFTTLGTDVSEDINVRMFFYTNTSEGEVYIDDINVEPVLNMGSSSYAARECRLYPNSNSLTCKDQSDNNTVRQGLEGYCLERDRINSQTCLTWYPADRISSSVLGGTGLGYSGPTGLSYCTNINSNIHFAKKVTAKLVLAYHDKSDKGHAAWIPNVNSNMCSMSLYQDFYAHNVCGSRDYYKALVVNVHEKKKSNYEYVYCVPNDNTAHLPDDDPNKLFLFPVGTKKPVTFLKEVPGDGSGCGSLSFYESAWMKYDGNMIQSSGPCTEKDKCEYIDEYANADPPIRVYNIDYPAIDEQGLQFLAADSGDRDKVFNFSCSQFDQRVSTSGDNKAWVIRTGLAANPDYAFNTPPFFYENTTANLQLYGRQMSGIPYGAATFPWNFDLLNSGPIYLQNQYYQKDNNDIYAGRPYGCSGISCDKVGYCSENPNVFCVYYPGTGVSVENFASTFCYSDADCKYISNTAICNMGSAGNNICSYRSDIIWPPDNDCSRINSVECESTFGAVCELGPGNMCTVRSDILWPPDNDCSEVENSQCSNYPDVCELKSFNFGTCSVTNTIIEPEGNERTYINIKTCSDGGFGVCKPLWTGNTPRPDNPSILEVRAANVLEQIFRKSYGTFNYTMGSYVPGRPSLPSVFSPPFGGSQPTISNARLYRLGSDTAITNFAVTEPGVYELRFNIRVNPEQQPLKMIYIDWGDGSRQAFTGHDNRPDANSPHVFYHYYTSGKSSPIIIRAWDNWEANSRWAQP